MWIPDNKELYDKFYENKSSIEDALSFPLTWDRLDDNKASHTYTTIDSLDFDNQENYEQLMLQIIDKVVALRKAFKPFV